MDARKRKKERQPRDPKVPTLNMVVNTLRMILQALDYLGLHA